MIFSGAAGNQSLVTSKPVGYQHQLLVPGVYTNN